MTPEQVQQMCGDALAKGPDITAADPWSARTGLELTFNGGARLWLAITTTSAYAAPARAETQAPPSPLPTLLRPDGKIPLLDAELYLASVLHGAGDPQILGAYAYNARSARPRNPGVGLLLADGGRAYLPIVFTARAGQQPGRRPFEQLQTLI